MDWAKIGESVLGSVLGSAGSSIVDKVVGVPTPPEALSGKELGDERRAELDAYAPGTSPWERLGSNPTTGAAQVAEQTSRTQMKLQRQELATRERIAERTNLATILASGSALGPHAVDALVDKFRNGGMSPSSRYDATGPQSRERLEAEKLQIAQRIRNLKQELKTEFQKSRVAQGEAERQGALTRIKGLEEEITRIQAKYAESNNIVGMGAKILGASSIGQAFSAIRQISSKPNNGRRPDRFNKGD